MQAMDTMVNPDWRGRGRRLVMLMRREVWEHRALWLLPLVLAGFVLLGALLGLAAPGRVNTELLKEGGHPIIVNGESSNLARLIPGLARSGIRVELGEVSTGNLLRFFAALPAEVRSQMILLALLATSKFLLLPLGFLAGLLVLNALRSEARSRSIYFFKSMPVSMGDMVLGKILVYLPGLALVMLATVVAGNIIVLLVPGVAALFFGLNPLALLWAPAPLAQVWGLVAQNLLVDLLMFLPVAGFLFALNAWHPGRRLLAAVVVFVVAVLQNIYSTGPSLFDWLGRHLLPPGWGLRRPRGDFFVEAQGWQQATPVDWLDVGSGVLIGLALLVLAAWLLRWREER